MGRVANVIAFSNWSRAGDVMAPFRLTQHVDDDLIRYEVRECVQINGAVNEEECGRTDQKFISQAPGAVPLDKIAAVTSRLTGQPHTGSQPCPSRNPADCRGDSWRVNNRGCCPSRSRESRTRSGAPDRLWRSTPRHCPPYPAYRTARRRQGTTRPVRS